MASNRKFFTKKYTGTLVERLNARSIERNQIVHILIGLGDNDQATMRMTEDEFDQKFLPHDTVVIDEYTVIDDLEIELTYHESIPFGFGPSDREKRTLRVPLSRIVETFKDRG